MTEPAPSPPLPAAGTGRARAWLDVPYADKDQAKVGGARWDPDAKRWYDPRTDHSGQPRPELARWAARADVPDLLPGEDRSFGSGLFVDMVPECWFTNVRSCVTQQGWERPRRMITRRAGHRCEICGAAEDRTQQRWLEAHERWAYDEHTGTQTLRRLICVCSPCHLSTHFGYANVTGRTGPALAHLREVTVMTQGEAWAHVEAAGDLWTARSRRTWTLDLSILTDAGVTPARPDSPDLRPETAQRELDQVRRTDRQVSEQRTEHPRRPSELRVTPPAPPPTSVATDLGPTDASGMCRSWLRWPLDRA